MTRLITIVCALYLMQGGFAQAANVAVFSDGTAMPATGPECALLNNPLSVKWRRDAREKFIKPDRRNVSNTVWISGLLLVKDDDMRDVELLIAVENGVCDQARIRRNGRFDILLPVGSRARLIFQKPEHIAKEVIVDAGNLRAGQLRNKRHKVDFDVILFSEEHFPGLRHDGPVGMISFTRGSGLMQVVQHEQMIEMDRAWRK